MTRRVNYRSLQNKVYLSNISFIGSKGPAPFIGEDVEIENKETGVRARGAICRISLEDQNYDVNITELVYDLFGVKRIVKVDEIVGAK